MQQIQNVTCTSDYTAATTIEDVFLSPGGYFVVAAGDVFMRLQYGGLGLTEWTDEVRVPIGNGTLLAGTTGVKFRNATSTPAVVTAGLSARAEPVFTIGSGGQAGSEVLTPYTAYTPAFSTVNNPQPNLGSSGGTKGWFTQFSNGMVHTYGSAIFFGVGISAGTGVYEITLPILPVVNNIGISSDVPAYRPAAGQAVYVDGANYYSCFPVIRHFIVQPIKFDLVIDGNGGFMDGTHPIVAGPGSGDEIMWDFVYQGVIS